MAFPYSMKCPTCQADHGYVFMGRVNCYHCNECNSRFSLHHTTNGGLQITGTLLDGLKLNADPAYASQAIEIYDFAYKYITNPTPKQTRLHKLTWEL